MRGGCHRTTASFQESVNGRSGPFAMINGRRMRRERNDRGAPPGMHSTTVS